ncbi:ankyrin repeat-containing domain protein, partial [Dunaliella salina]
DGWTPLLCASQQGHVPIVKELISKGASVNKAEECGHTPLWEASCLGHLAVVKVLIAAGASLDIQAETEVGW